MQHAAWLGHLFDPAGPVYNAYFHELEQATRVPREVMVLQSRAWLAALPWWAQEEIDGLSRGLRRPVEAVASFLYADIATVSGGPNSISIPGGSAEAEILSGGGPGCSGFVTPVGGAPWVARNCDWLVATLRRGTAAVVHETPGRIPVLALGIMGDIDVDTGVNAAGLWLHLHTLPSNDGSRPGRARFSWLFWAREALETCASLAELEAFIARTDRDRGVIVIAIEGQSGRAALFECGRASFVRYDAGQGAHGVARSIVATNHPQARHPARIVFAEAHDAANADGARVSRRGSTVRRYQRVCEVLHGAAPEHAPDDLIEVLADDDVEMRHATSLRTIYSAACCPSEGEIWFAPGEHASRSPAASSTRWGRVEWPWETRRNHPVA